MLPLDYAPLETPLVPEATRKERGAYFTPASVVESLVRWAIREPSDRLLDPSCGDGRFLAVHERSVGIEQHPESARQSRERAPHAAIHCEDFFAWANGTTERFECAAGNPPFIRYQTFNGATRKRALALCERLGATFNGLASSWAPFLVAAAGLLRPGGRVAFVVPAEIGHAPYSAPLFEYLAKHFSTVQIVAVREKLFPELSEDCWLLYAEGFGGSTSHVRFTALDHFSPSSRPPSSHESVPVRDWREKWNCRLRPYLASRRVRELYLRIANSPHSMRLGDDASVGIGYVTGANDFFHLRPSEARQWDIPERLLQRTVRNGRCLPPTQLTHQVVEGWIRSDDPVMLLRIPREIQYSDLPPGVRRYLDTEQGLAAREAFKCRSRDPWYSVPDVRIPDLFLTYMSGETPSLVRNDADCSGTNSVHVIHLKHPECLGLLTSLWQTSFMKLSCELEGHPLGGGMLKLEPREAGRLVFPGSGAINSGEQQVAMEGVSTLRRWRHYER